MANNLPAQLPELAQFSSLLLGGIPWSTDAGEPQYLKLLTVEWDKHEVA